VRDEVLSPCCWSRSRGSGSAETQAVAALAVVHSHMVHTDAAAALLSDSTTHQTSNHLMFNRTIHIRCILLKTVIFYCISNGENQP